MNEPITYVGIDAHARELQLAMLIGDAARPVSWTSPTESARSSGCAENWNATRQARSNAATKRGRTGTGCNGVSPAIAFAVTSLPRP